jgi:AraC-like DNA-binding protein
MELTTDRVPERDRLAFWTEAVSRVLTPVTVTARDARTFSGRITSEQLGYLRISTIEASPARVTREARQSSAAAERYLAVGLQRSGHAALRQDGRVARVGPGQLVLWDTSRPHVLDHPGGLDLVVFRIPRRAIGLSDTEVEQATARAISPDAGVGGMLAPFLAALAETAGSCRADVADRLAGNTIDLVATLVAEHAEPKVADQDVAHRALALRIRQFVNLNLGDPELSPEGIAAEHSISVRYLHRLFEGEGTTVGRWIQQRRLEECSRELPRRGAVNPTVSAVARRWGFTNASHFSRVFRAAYGMTPREWRVLREELAAVA